MSIFNWTTLGVTVTVIYLGFAVHNFVRLMNPLSGVEISSDTVTVDPLWHRNESLNIFCFFSQSQRFNGLKISKIREQGMLLMQHEINFDDEQELSFDFILYRREKHTVNLDVSSQSEPHKFQLKSKKMWESLQFNQSNVYLHALVTRGSEIDEISSNHLRNGTALYGVVGLIKYDIIPKTFRHRYLLSDFGLVNISEVDGEPCAMIRCNQT